jgi:hypothetical protein
MNNYVCTNCSKKCRDNYDLTRHLSRKTPCKKKNNIPQPKITETQPTLINITINNNQQIINYYHTPNSSHITKKQLNKSISIFNEEKPLYTTGKAIGTYRELLQLNPENRNVHIDPKSAIGHAYDKLTWVPKLKKDIINDTIKESARNFSDNIDITGVQAPENLVNCLEIIASEGLDISHETLQLENFKALTLTENRELVNGVAIILRK